MGRDYKVIAIDFDGTLFETEYPKILRPILPVIEMAKARQEKGDKLILWTCREGPELDAAMEACREQGLEFDAINDNLEEAKTEWGNNPRKVAADEYWDDKNAWNYSEYDEDGDEKFRVNISIGKDRRPEMSIWEKFYTLHIPIPEGEHET